MSLPRLLAGCTGALSDRAGRWLAPARRLRARSIRSGCTGQAGYGGTHALWTWALLGSLAPLGMLLLSGLMLLQLRQDVWDKAELNANNLLRVVANDVARNVEIIDLSLQAVIENLKLPGFAGIGPDMRQRLLFHRTATARSLGMMVLLDEHGDVVVSSHARPVPKFNFADRDYFRVHHDNPDAGLYISRTFTSRISNAPMIGFSRRVSKPDGSFGGVVVGTLKLSYFAPLLEGLDLGEDGAISLLRTDGTRLMRHPYVESDINANLAGSENFERLLRERQGGFAANAVRDGIERYYAFAQVGTLPLVATIARGTDDIEAEWRGKALVIGGTMLVLAALTVGLTVRLARELRQRTAIQAELARLSMTDGLTALPNRRRFDLALNEACLQARERSGPLALLVIDVDHFKRINDRHGHATGDAVLRALARGLSAGVHRPEDIVCRIGGEEFAVLLPNADRAAALAAAERIHAAAATVAAPGIAPGAVTVSIGLVAAGGRDPAEVYALADAALYEAKAAGRNRTHCAPASTGPQAGHLRLVNAC